MKGIYKKKKKKETVQVDKHVDSKYGGVNKSQSFKMSSQKQEMKPPD